MTDIEVGYARSAGVNIAYQVTGGGAIDLVLVPGFVSHLEVDWEEPRSAHFLDRLGSFARLIRFDKRGTGLSDRPGGLPDLETRMDDVRAVMDAVGSERAALFGYSEGGPMSVLFTATYPDRASALVLYGSYAKRVDPDDDYPWAPTRANRTAEAARIESVWGAESDISNIAPSADVALDAVVVGPGPRLGQPRCRPRPDPHEQQHRRPPGASRRSRCRRLVLHRVGDTDARVEEGRYIAAHIPGARFVELDGDDHLPWIDPDQIVDEVEEFLTGVRSGPTPDRVLATVVFTDIVGSTELAAEPRRSPMA